VLSKKSCLSCTRTSLGHDEPLLGTAPPGTRGYVLVEYSPGWPHLNQWNTKLPSEMIHAQQQAEACGLQFLLIRRVGAPRRLVSEPRIYAAFIQGNKPWVHGGRLTGLSTVGTLDMGAIAEGYPPDGTTPLTEPLLFVCTHGKQDMCCSVLGLKFAKILAQHKQFHAAVWEVSHIGGHRFAPTLFCLSNGTCYYYGRVGLYHNDFGKDDVNTQEVLDFARTCHRGEVDLKHCRGNATWPAAVQAAEVFAREKTGEREVSAVQPLEWFERDGNIHVELRVGEELCHVTVTSAYRGVRRLSCSSGYLPENLPHFELVDITPAPEPRLATA